MTQIVARPMIILGNLLMSKIETNSLSPRMQMKYGPMMFFSRFAMSIHSRLSLQ